MDSVNWIRGYVEVLFRAYDVDILAVGYSLANERHVLQTKYGKVFLQYILFPKNMHRLQVKSTLTEDGSDKSSSLQVWLDLSKDFIFSVCW